MSRKESIGRLKARQQSSSGPPAQDMVSVAVLPPRLPQGLAPPTGVGAADCFNFDESINWRHNEPIDDNEGEVGKKKAFFRRAGLTTQRKKVNPDLPPFVLRQIPYETWRKHYAKDKDGNYRGTLAPAEDCLLKPDDVAKWRLGPPVTKADQWTRGKEILPVYAEVQTSESAPEYNVDYDGPPPAEPVIRGQGGELAYMATPRAGSGDSAFSAVEGSMTTSEPVFRRNTIANGKTAEEIIAEAKAKPAPKMTWRQKLAKGAAGTMGA